MWLTRPGSVLGGIVHLDHDFGGDEPPSYNMPDIHVPTAEELYNQAQGFYSQNYPTLLNAQSTALANVNDPNYYANFQPTSFENALANQYFQNIWPDQQALIQQQFANSGLSGSPALAATLGKAYGQLGTSVGSYLADQGNQRATNAINAGLGISPGSLLNPFVQTGQAQSNTQADLALAQSQAAYQNALNQYQYGQQKKQAFGGLIGGGLGAVGGAMIGMPFQGAAFGSQLGTGVAGGAMNPYVLTMSGMDMMNGMEGFGDGDGEISPKTLQAFGGGISNDWNKAAGNISKASRVQSVYPNLSFRTV